MRTCEVMSNVVRTCYEWDSLEEAAEILWESDVGCVVVVDEQRCPVGVLTDRDLAMAAYTQGVALSHARVASAMSKHVVVTRADATTDEVEALMRTHRLHRLPVVDEQRRLIGIVSLTDIARAALRESPELLAVASIAKTLMEVGERRPAQKAAVA